MKRNILLYGTGTFKNRGVEAIVNSTINQIDKNKNDITIACFDIDYNKNMYKNRVKYINQYRKDSLSEKEKQLEEKYKSMPYDYRNFELLYQKDVVKEMKKSDICISIGGDNYCYEPCDWLYALDSKSHELGKKTVLWGASLFEKIENPELLQNLNNFDVVVIRESLTLDAIKDYVDKEKIIFEKDPAFSLKMKVIKRNDWYKNRKYMILNVSPLTIKTDENYDAIINFMNYILDNTNYSICLLPHVTTDTCSDMEILSKLATEYEEEERVYLETNNYNCEELKYIISGSKFAIVARTHASIAAYSTFVPTLVIGYSVKSRGIAKDLFGDYENYVINRENLKEDKLIEKYLWIEKNRYKIINSLKKQMPSIVKNTSHIFEKVLKKLEEQEKKYVCDPKDCINCNLCTKVCPVDAIETIETDLHFKYNKKNIKKCINCGKCLEICPIVKNADKEKYVVSSYAVKNKDVEIQKQSTSGGVFTAIAEYILNKKGIVYGAERSNNKTQHIRVTNKKDLSKIRGSKYSYSHIEGILDSIVDDVKQKKLILFSGTPCQVGAIKKLVGNYNKIYYVSVICHGVLNDELVKDYCTHAKVKLLDYRTKENGWSKASVKYDKYTNIFMDDTFLALYINNDLLRESCYRCRYTLDNNPSDLILGDYWGIKDIDEKSFDDNGVSIMIVNSSRGKEIINNIKQNLVIQKTSTDHLKNTHPNLLKSPIKPIERYTAREFLKNNTWDSLYQICMSKRKIEELNREINKIRGCLDEKEQSLNRIRSNIVYRAGRKVYRIIKKVIK